MLLLLCRLDKESLDEKYVFFASVEDLYKYLQNNDLPIIQVPPLLEKATSYQEKKYSIKTIPDNSLTEDRKFILTKIGEGYSIKEIYRLGRKNSVKVIEYHVANIQKLFNVKSHVLLAHFAVALGLIKPIAQSVNLLPSLWEPADKKKENNLTIGEDVFCFRRYLNQSRGNKKNIPPPQNIKDFIYVPPKSPYSTLQYPPVLYDKYQHDIRRHLNFTNLSNNIQLALFHLGVDAKNIYAPPNRKSFYRKNKIKLYYNSFWDRPGRNLWEILEAAYKKYRQLIWDFHPDRNKNKEKQMVQINESWDIVKTQFARRGYVLNGMNVKVPLKALVPGYFYNHRKR
jgi:hypothetical protein